MDYKSLRQRYSQLRYESYEIDRQEKQISLRFRYRLLGRDGEEIAFSHSIRYEWMVDAQPVPFACAGQDLQPLENFVFQIGVAESISYWKLACPEKLVIACGKLPEQAIPFWKKLYYNGLGEFIYLNKIHLEQPEVTEDSLVDIVLTGESVLPRVSGKDYQGTLIPVGGGKDSVVTLELLKETAAVNLPFVMSPPQAAYDCIEVAGYQSYLLATRTLDKKIIEMNAQGYLNGHVPFSAILAFIAAYGAAIMGKKYIALSNEKSANEPSVPNTHFNHQYSKTLEFEQDFTAYFQNYIMPEIEYFSLLRPLYEIEIAEAFAGYEAYHTVFRSCNRGKKTNVWCGECSKCLFVYIMLSPYIERKRLAELFGKDLLADEKLIPILRELLGLEETKPFECVGTIWEVRLAMAKTAERYGYDKENRSGETPALMMEYLKADLAAAKPNQNYEVGDCIPAEFKELVKH